MVTLFVAKSARLAEWASDVGLSKHVYKLGLTDEPVKAVVAAGWAGETDWTLVKKEDGVEGLSEDEAIQRLAAKTKMIDPALYPRIRGTLGLFKVVPAQVENHLIVARALAGTETAGPIKLKPADFALYLIKNAMRTPREASDV